MGQALAACVVRGSGIEDRSGRVEFAIEIHVEIISANLPAGAWRMPRETRFVRPLLVMRDRLEGEEEKPAAGVLDIVFVELAVIADVGEIDVLGEVVRQLRRRRPDLAIEPGV